MVFLLLLFFQLTIPNFHQVTPDIYRGARPSANDIAELKNKGGIKTIIDLEDDDFAIQQEQAVANSLKMNFVSLPMSVFLTPNDSTVNTALALLNDPSKYPIFIHCKQGEDRTGLIVGLYRVFTQKWTPQKAYAEMLNLGFHSYLFPLRNYYIERTGLTN